MSTSSDYVGSMAKSNDIMARLEDLEWQVKELHNRVRISNHRFDALAKHCGVVVHYVEKGEVHKRYNPIPEEYDGPVKEENK